MAIFHSSIQVISRGQGKSCVAAAAYRSGEKLYDERQNMSHDYTKKHDVESEIIAPGNAPAWVYDRQKLWNEVDRAETRCNSRTARELNIALPVELHKDQQKELAREYVKENFVNKGMVADLCFHFNDINNPHFHVMLTTREISKDGFTNKNRDWDKKENATMWREQWANHANKALEKAGFQERIDHRSYEEQGIDKVPTIHLGKTSSEMQKKGIDNTRSDINNQIRELNRQRVIALQEYRDLKEKLKQEKSNRYSNLLPDERAAVLKAEQFIKVPLTYESAENALKTLGNMREHKLDEIYSTPYESEKEKIRSYIKGIDKCIGNINNGIKALQNKDLREFYKEYKEYFPKEKYYFKYDEMKQIKYISQELGHPISIKELKSLYTENGSMYEDTENKIKSIKDNVSRLEKAHDALNTIEKYQNIADKWNTKTFGKARFQKEHQFEKSQYDNAKDNLKKYGIRNKYDLRSQERAQESNVKETLPKLQAKQQAISITLKTIGNVLQVIGNAQRNAQSQQQHENNFTKAFKDKYLEDEMQL
ncbi:MAG: MobA/MobL family protein [Spirochaetes bacterium]|nr:MobA/MobL family protein [Spirochaetota bacterium]